MSKPLARLFFLDPELELLDPKIEQPGVDHCAHAGPVNIFKYREYLQHENTDKPSTTGNFFVLRNMQINLALLATLASSVFSIANGVAVDARAALDIFDPHIISPNASTIWVIGNVESVTWDTSDAPENISNRASVRLIPAGQLSPQFILASDFDLRSGSVDVTVPGPTSIVPGEYTITLYGDSGNISPPFEIIA